MKRILLEFPGLDHGRLFDPRARDNVSEPFRYLRDRLLALGFDLVTADDHPVRDAAAIWFWDVPELPRRRRRLIDPLRDRVRKPRRDLLGECLDRGIEHRLALFIGEPPVVNPANWEERRWAPFPTVFTWADDIVDGSRFIKYVAPVPSRHPAVPDTPFGERRLLANISANKRSEHPAELYSARRAMIRTCERVIPGQFALFGRGWSDDPDRYPSYEGMPQHKWDVYPRFRFGLSYENMVGERGYVTEKIIDCIRGGAVPVYLGAPNITDYVDADAFVDRRDFDSDADLVQYLATVSESDHTTMRSAGRRFLGSDRFARFLPEHFANTVISRLAPR